MNTALPVTIPAYLAQLRRSLEGADAAMVQDALYDAEEYLRAELAANPGKSEAEVIADVAGSYGAPDEVADIYRDTETKVQTALRPPRPVRRANDGPSAWQKVFGVFVDWHTYGALFYMLLSLATGIFYFTWTVTGASLSLGLSILIIGLPFIVLFVGATRVLALVEGRLVEVMLGERMPRRPLYSDAELPLLKCIWAMFTDARTWGTFLYFLLMMPLGTAYFVIATAGLSAALGLMFGPLVGLAIGHVVVLNIGDVDVLAEQPAMVPLAMLAGFVVLLLTLHVARWIGRLHGRLAKAMLVKA